MPVKAAQAIASRGPIQPELPLQDRLVFGNIGGVNVRQDGEDSLLVGGLSGFKNRYDLVGLGLEKGTQHGSAGPLG